MLVVCKTLNHLNHVDIPSGQSSHWLGYVPKDPTTRPQL